MATLAIRDFDKELLIALKVKAAKEGKTLKQVCTELLTVGVSESGAAMGAMVGMAAGKAKGGENPDKVFSSQTLEHVAPDNMRRGKK